MQPYIQKSYFNNCCLGETFLNEQIKRKFKKMKNGIMQHKMIKLRKLIQGKARTIIQGKNYVRKDEACFITKY